MLDPQGQIGVRWIKPPGTETAYIGDEACRSCHPSEFKAHALSSHAHTLIPVLTDQKRSEFTSSQTVIDPINSVQYSLRQTKGKNQMVAVTNSTTEAATARWAFGSGKDAWTFLAQHDSKFLQLRISYYPAIKAWNFTPGSGPSSFHERLGDPYSAVQAAACFGCHSTVVVGTQENLDLPHSRINVGCRSCHGPSRSHVEAANKAKANKGTPNVIPPLDDGPKIMQLCGQCHRIPVAVSDANVSMKQLARFPGEALPRSRCFIESGDKLSCVTCHNPHQNTKSQGISSFEAACTNCHSAPAGKACTIGKKTGCIDCHMPIQSISARLPLSFHNHWIRKNPGQ